MKSTWDSVAACSSAVPVVSNVLFISRNTSTPSITCVLGGDGREGEREGKASRESHIEMCIIFGHKNLVRECTVGTYTHTYMHTHITLHTHVLYVHIHAHTYRRKGEMDEEERRDG